MLEPNNDSCCDGEELIVGFFAIRLDWLNMEQMKRLRYLLPRNEYRKIKDRKSARDSRRERS